MIQLLKDNKIRDAEKLISDSLDPYILETMNSKQPTDKSLWPS
jgi:hypothetical protein